MKETILYISKSEEDIQSFLKYLQSKLKAEQKECTLDEKHSILKVPKYYDIVGRVFTEICLARATDIANITVFQKHMIKINTAMQKMKGLKEFLCTQERVRREYRNLIFYVC